MNEYIVGIDVGASKICGAVGKVSSKSKLQIVGITTVKCNGLKKSVVVDLDSTSEAIKECIQQLEVMVGIEIKEAYISLPGGLCELVKNNAVIDISSEEREISSGDIDKVLDAVKCISVPTDKQIIGVEPEQFSIDGYDNIKDPIGMRGNKLEVQAQIVMAEATVIYNLLKSIKKAGVEVKGILGQPTAIFEVVNEQIERDTTTAIVDVGSQTVDISIYKNGKVCYTSIIYLGGENITNDIEICLNVHHTEAEKLKVKYGSIYKQQGDFEEKIKAKSSYDYEYIEIDYDMLIDIINARVQEMLYLVKGKLFESSYFEEVNSVIFIGGGISLFRGISDLSREILNKPIKVVSPEYVGAASPMYVTAVGIVKEVSNIVNLQNDLLDGVNEYATENLWDEKKNKKDKNGFASKIREFFADFF